MIDITLLGVSALLPLPDRALTAVALRCCGRTILFDCGEGTQAAARKAGVGLLNADLIALTHYHGDHVFGLPGLMQTMGVMGRTEPLYITGPTGLEAALAPILTLTEGLPFPLRLIETPPEGLAPADLFPGWPSRAVLTAFPTNHRVPSQGYCFSLGRAGKFDPDKARALSLPQALWGEIQSGRAVQWQGITVAPDQVLGPARPGIKFVFSGDTAPCESLMEAARDADLMICEATYGEDSQADLAVQYGHMTFSAAGQAAARAGVKQLWLAHFSQRIKEPEAYLPSAQAFYPAAQCGADGMRITLAFPSGA